MKRPVRVGVSVAASRPAHAQLITLAVGNLRGPDDSALVRRSLARVDGVETVYADPENVRVWVFGDGTIEPLELVDELASCGYGASVLGHQLGVPE